jgi:predicted nuclease with RNAse H fold
MTCGHCPLTVGARAAMVSSAHYAHDLVNIRMALNVKRWSVVALLILSMRGVAVADEHPVTTDAAEAAVAQAQAAVKLAADQRALWTSAEEALRKARRALREGNAAMAVELARFAQKQSELGIAQKDYPLFR